MTKNCLCKNCALTFLSALASCPRCGCADPEKRAERPDLDKREEPATETHYPNLPPAPKKEASAPEGETTEGEAGPEETPKAEDVTPKAE